MDIFRKTGPIVVRELEFIRKRPAIILSSLVAVVFCSFFFHTMFGEGLPEKLPIGVVDMDGSYISRRFIREINSTQSAECIEYTTFREAREALQKGEIYALFNMPENLYQDILSNRQPELSFYINSSYLIAGSLSYKELLTMANLASGAVQREVLRAKGLNEDAIMGIIQPIVIDTHQIGNQYANYGIYLQNTLLPGVLELSILLIITYVLGIELKERKASALLEKAEGSIIRVVTGKLLPYTIMFTILGALCCLSLYGIGRYPVNGSVWNMMLYMFLFVLACEGMAVTIISILPVLRDGVCISALTGILAFTFAGFTFPVEYMPGPVRGLACLFPLRHYYRIFVNECIYGTGLSASYMEIAAMLMFLLPPLILAPRLKNAYKKQHYPIN